MTIAIFDSGAGGLTVFKTFLNLSCAANYIYFADYQHLPYGDKKPAEVAAYVVDSVNFLAKKKIDALVIACNTATSLAIKELRNQSQFNFPIFGMEPAVKLAVDQLEQQDIGSRAKKAEVLIAATSITAKSQQLATLKQNFAHQANYDTVILPELITAVENNNFNQEKINNYLRKNINQEKKYDAIVLGCTHYSFFRDNFSELFPQSLIVDGNLGTASHLIKQLKLNCAKNQKNQENKEKISFYFSKKRNAKLRKKYQALLKVA